MIPDNVLYTKEHEWIREEGDTAYVGITEFAQKLLGDITYVELPEEGREVNKGEDFCAIESVKAVSDVYAPAGGVIVSVNSRLAEDPGLVNRDPYGEGWICTLKITDKSELSSLMKSSQYEEYI